MSDQESNSTANFASPPDSTQSGPPDLTANSPGDFYAKITWRLVPLLFLSYIIAYIDRINIGFAKLQLREVLGVDPNVFGSVYGLGAGLFFIGYFLFEIPSNLVMQRVGARLWIARIMVIWGLVSMAMMFISGKAGFYSVRFLLGVAEAGFFPGVILYLTYWYPAKERARIVALFASAAVLAGVLGSPLSGSILELQGKGGLEGWQWLFLLEGIPAVLMGLVVLFALPDRPRKGQLAVRRGKELDSVPARRGGCTVKKPSASPPVRGFFKRPHLAALSHLFSAERGRLWLRDVAALNNKRFLGNEFCQGWMDKCHPLPCGNGCHAHHRKPFRPDGRKEMARCHCCRLIRTWFCPERIPEEPLSRNGLPHACLRRTEIHHGTFLGSRNSLPERHGSCRRHSTHKLSR